MVHMNRGSIRKSFLAHSFSTRSLTFRSRCSPSSCKFLQEGNVRILAATNRNLRAEAEAAAFDWISTTV
jgi:hypothetical protein